MAASVVAVVTVLAVVSACSSSGNGSDNSGGAQAPGAATKTVTAAGTPGQPPNWIWPFPDSAHLTPTNLPWQEMMFKPLYWFGQGGKPKLNTKKSLAHKPKYSSDHKSVTIKLKSWKWSDGSAITADNVKFWLNLAKTEKKKLGIYVPGYIPDNISSAKVTGKRTIQLKLDKAYNPEWYTFAQLSQIFPFPKAWDATAPGKKADCSTSKSDCASVYKYLQGQAKKLPKYDSDPLWKVTNGPWKLDKFNSDGHISMVPNQKYSGPDKPKIKKYKMVPFTSESAEYNALQAHKIDIGSIPTNALPGNKPKGPNPLKAGPNPVKQNYDMKPSFSSYGIGYMVLNYNNPKLGPLFKKQYFRQALASSIDQKTIIDKVYKGYGVKSTGPVPTWPKTKWIPKAQKSDPYPFDTDNAKKYLSDHGWKVNPGGASRCVKPGTGTDQCGKGVKKGQKAGFEYAYFAGSVTGKTYAKALKSDASKAGIDITLHSMPGNVLAGKIVPCKGPKCTWESSDGGWYYVYYPSGEQVFATGANANFGSFSDPQVNKMIKATQQKSDLSTMHKYATETGKKLPGIWTPSQAGLNAYAKGLKGYEPENPYSFPNASDLYFE